MRRSDKNTAFTLAEVVLAVTLAMGLAGGVLAFYRHVSDIRRRVRAQGEDLAAERCAHDRHPCRPRSHRASHRQAHRPPASRNGQK